MVACPECSHGLTAIDLKTLDEGLPKFIGTMPGKDPKVRSEPAENIHQQFFKCENFAWICGNCGYRRIDDEFLKYFDRLDVAAGNNNIGLYIDFLDSLKAVGGLDSGERDEALAYYEQGCTFTTQGRHGEAVAAYRKALQLNPDYPSAYNNMGISLAKQNKYDEAIAAYRKFIQLEPPDQALGYYNLGNALRNQGKIPDAIAAYRKAVEVKPDYGNAYNNMGGALLSQDRLDEAIAACRMAIRFMPEPHNALGYKTIGICLERQGKYPEAILACKKAVELYPDLSDAYEIMAICFYNRAVSFEEQGKNDRARADYEKANALRGPSIYIDSSWFEFD